MSAISENIKKVSEHLDSAKEILKNPAEALKDPSLLPSDVGNSLQEMKKQVGKAPEFFAEIKSGLKKMATPSSEVKADSPLAQTFSISDAEGNKVNLQNAAEGFAAILSAFAKLF